MPIAYDGGGFPYHDSDVTAYLADTPHAPEEVPPPETPAAEILAAERLQNLEDADAERRRVAAARRTAAARWLRDRAQRDA